MRGKVIRDQNVNFGRNWKNMKKRGKRHIEMERKRDKETHSKSEKGQIKMQSGVMQRQRKKERKRER